jgi:hypothetical protein
MDEDLFEQARKVFFGSKEVSSVSRDTERDFEDVLELASKMLQRMKAREETPTQQ